MQSAVHIPALSLTPPPSLHTFDRSLFSQMHRCIPRYSALQSVTVDILFLPSPNFSFVIHSWLVSGWVFIFFLLPFPSISTPPIFFFPQRGVPLFFLLSSAVSSFLRFLEHCSIGQVVQQDDMFANSRSVHVKRQMVG